MKKNMIFAELEKDTRRSAWDRGVALYAEELVNKLFDNVDCGYIEEEDLKSMKLVEKALLNGAEDWSQYSWGGCSLIYDYDIAKRLCNPSELKKTRNGERKPNKNEEWLDTQARALFQACERVKKAIKVAAN